MAELLDLLVLVRCPLGADCQPALQRIYLLLQLYYMLPVMF